MKTDNQVKQAIQSIARNYGVELVSITRNIQTSVDVVLDRNIYCKEQEKMEAQIRSIPGVAIDDIDYRDVV